MNEDHDIDDEQRETSQIGLTSSICNNSVTMTPAVLMYGNDARPQQLLPALRSLEAFNDPPRVGIVYIFHFTSEIMQHYAHLSSSANVLATD
jgi:hypothetical protein